MSQGDDADSSGQDLKELYQDLILDHGKRPHNFRPMEDAQCQQVGHNPLCGDQIVLFLKVDEKGRIADASFQGNGCAISMASASMMTEMLKGKTAEEAKKLEAYFRARCMDQPVDPVLEATLSDDDKTRLGALAGVKHFPMRVKCATLAWVTLDRALDPDAGDEEGGCATPVSSA